MSHLAIPIAVVYAGLAGTLLALLVAAATNRWSPRVFCLLALRLAIGWHFLFEGLHKVHTHDVGPSATSTPFSSEGYFKNSSGPLGEQMRKQFSDPVAEIAAKVRVPESIAAADFRKLSTADQAAKCPPAVAKLFDDLNEKARETAKSRAEADKKAATEAEAKAVKDATDAEAKAMKDLKDEAAKVTAKAGADAARAKATADADAARAAAQKRADDAERGGDELVTVAKVTYARWVYGVDARPATRKFINGDLLMTGPERLDYLDSLRREARAADERQAGGLGMGTGTDNKRIADARSAVQTAEADLARDANAFVEELRADLGFKADPAVKPELSRGQLMDRVTMWFLVVVGSCIMAGLFTRVACVMAAGFLVMTYLAQPPFPWYPPPPPSEGNPVFINKNLIEALALVALACYPTGRWLGLDALVLRPFRKYRDDRPA